MNMKELMTKSPEYLEQVRRHMLSSGNLVAVTGIDYVLTFANKRVKVIKGRKVPIGTEGICFWMGSYCNSPYGDPWGIYTRFRCGIKDDAGNIYWTSLENIAVA